MTTLALLVDSLRRRARGVNIGCFLNVEGCLAHAVHILLPFSWDALNRVVPRQPVGWRHGRDDVALREGIIEVVELIRVAVHVVKKPGIPPFFDLCRRCFGRWRGCFRLVHSLNCSLFFLGTTEDAQCEPDN